MTSLTLHPRSLLAGLGLALLAACQSPNVDAFDAASQQLRLSIHQTSDLLIDDVNGWTQEEAIQDFLASKPSFQRLSGEITASWQKRKDLADAIGLYSASIVNLSNAGFDGGKAANQLADSISNLLDVAQVDGGQTIKDGAAKGESLFDAISSVRATRKLDQALRRSAPVVSEIAGALEADFQDARRLAKAELQLQRTVLAKEFNSYSAISRQAKANADQIVARISHLASEGGDGGTSPQPASAGRVAAPSESKLLREELSYELQLVEYSRPYMDMYKLQSEQLLREYQLKIQIMDRSIAATQAWAQSHHALAMNAESMTEFNLQNVMYVVQQISQTAEQLKVL